MDAQRQLTASTARQRLLVARLRSIETHEGALLPLLSEQERKIAWAFPSRKRTFDFIAGRMIVKLCLRRLLGTDYRQVDIGRDFMGRPLLRISGRLVDGVAIAISHGGGYIYCGAALGTKIGLDVEPISGKLFELREIWTAPEERRRIASESSDIMSRDANFTRLWSSKESLAKYLDVGFDHVLKHAHLRTFIDEHVILHYASDHACFDIRCETVLHRGHIFAFLRAP